MDRLVTAPWQLVFIDCASHPALSVPTESVWVPPRAVERLRVTGLMAYPLDLPLLGSYRYSWALALFANAWEVSTSLTSLRVVNRIRWNFTRAKSLTQYLFFGL